MYREIPSFKSRLDLLSRNELREDETILPGWPDELDLGQRLVHVIQTCQRERLPCQYLGTMPLFEDHRVYPGSERDWVMMPLAQDPLFAQQDQYPIPASTLRQLQQIDRASIDFDIIYVAHEVEKNTVVQGEAVPLKAVVPPAPPNVQRLSQRLGQTARSLFTLALAPLVAWSAASAALGAMVAALPAAILDPVLFGVVVRPGRDPQQGEVGGWFYLAHWQYGSDGPAQQR